MVGARNMPQFNLRMPQDLMLSMKELAEINGRSMNSELVQIVKEYVAKNNETPKCSNTDGVSNLSTSKQGI